MARRGSITRHILIRETERDIHLEEEEKTTNTEEGLDIILLQLREVEWVDDISMGR
jgi:hypothetical protein